MEMLLSVPKIEAKKSVKSIGKSSAFYGTVLRTLKEISEMHSQLLI